MSDLAELGNFVRLRTTQLNPKVAPTELFDHFSIPNFDETGTSRSELGSTIESGKFLLDGPAVLVSKLNPRKMRVLNFPGSAAQRSVASTEFMVFESQNDEDIELRFLSHLLAGEDFARKLQSVATGTTNSHVRVRPNETLRWPVQVPSLTEQRRIAEILDTIDETIQATERVIAKLVTARTALTHTLLGGAPVKRSIRLGELALSSVDGPFGSGLTSAHYVDGPGVRVVRLSNLGDGEFINNDKAYVSENYATTLGRHDARPGDLLIASLGDERHRPGRACMYPTGERDGIVKADCFRFRLDQSIAEPAFVMCRINQHDIGRQIARLSGGVTRDRVNLGNLRTIEIPLPPIGDQRSIVDLLSASAVQIKQENDRLTKHRKLRSGVASDLLSGRVRTVAL